VVWQNLRAGQGGGNLTSQLWSLVSDQPVPGSLLSSLSAPPSPGLALMVQLARELKTLARDFGMAVVVRN
jgi:hypothetical protein